MTLKVTWAGGLQSPSNFGDMLTPKILEYFGISYEYSPECLVICTGSIARYANSNTMVLGSGIISRSDKLSPDANWVFVRGPYTRNRIISLGGGVQQFMEIRESYCLLSVTKVKKNTMLV
jgi:hypothetical protein